MNQDHPSNAGMKFPTTSWSLIQTVKYGSGNAREKALNELVRQYWKPIYAYFRHYGRPRQQAEELVQRFLLRLDTKNLLDSVRQDRGKFRTFLKTCAHNFMLDEIRRDAALKRQVDSQAVTFSELVASDGLPFEPGDLDTADPFEDAWRREVLSKALLKTQMACAKLSREDDFELFREYYLEPSGENVTWAEIAERNGISNPVIASRKSEFVKRQFRNAFKDVVRVYVDSEDEVKEELRQMIGKIGKFE